LAPADDAEPYASYQVTSEPDQSDYESMTITHGDRGEGAPNMKNTTPKRAACACEHRDSEADAAAALRRRLAGAWREPEPARGSARAPSAVGTDERAVMAAFRARLANAWRGE
jgi:hypothetical protein